MYTKILLLVAISIIISSSVSSNFSHLKMTTHTEKISDYNFTPSGEKQKNANLPFGIDWSLPHQDTTGHPHQNSDDDGKSLHFHFEHFAHNRRRIFIFHSIARMILIMAFVSSLISFFYMYRV